MTIANAQCSLAGVELPVWNSSAERWANRLIPLSEYLPFDEATPYNYDLAHLHLKSPYPQPETRIGTLRWPTGASRWAVAHFAVTQDKLDEIRAAAGEGNTPLPLVMTDEVTGETLETELYMLPPRPLLVGTPVTDDGPLWVITLVDDRFYWWQQLVTTDPVPSTWTELFADLADALGVIIPEPDVPAAYLTPTNRYRAYSAPAPLLLDSAAEAVGLRLVRDLDGTLTLQPWADARTNSSANYAAYTAAITSGDFAGRGRVRGGGLLASGDITRCLPERLAVVFGRQVDGATSSGQYVVTRTLTSYTRVGGSLSLSAYMGSAGGMSGRTGRFTADAYAEYTGSALEFGNEATLTSLAEQAAHDWYGWQLGNVDVELAGVIPWETDAFADKIVWTYDEGKVTTRVARGPYFDANVYGYHSQAAAAGGGGDDSFWAALTFKSTDSCPNYQFVEVETAGSPFSNAWTEVAGGRTGSAFDVNCVDLPAVPVDDGPVVVRMYLDDDGDYYFESAPRWEFVKPTGAASGGYYPGVLTTFGAGGFPENSEVILILDLNS